MRTFNFKAPATETTYGTAYFTVEAESEEEARKLLADDASEYFDDFSSESGETTWDAEKPEDFEVL